MPESEPMRSPSSDRPIDAVSLRMFVAVCEERTIARAAEREAIVASAVSKRIAAIERDLGTPLLRRGRRGIAPTAAGEALLRHAREVLGLMARMRAELGAFTQGVHGSVRLVASVSALAGALPDDVAAFLAQQRAVRVSMDEQISQDVVRSVREGAADLGVVWDAVELGDLVAWPYRADHLCVALPRGHGLAGRKRLRFAELLAHDAIGVAPGGLMDALLRRQAALLGHTLAPRVQVSSMDAACRIVAAGLGLAVLPRESARPQAAAAALVMVPLAEPWGTRRFVICTRPGAAPSASARGLIDHLLRAAAA
jgi:DNA-binding transcriptional LysR family regulator